MIALGAKGPFDFGRLVAHSSVGIDAAAGNEIVAMQLERQLREDRVSARLGAHVSAPQLAASGSVTDTLALAGGRQRADVD